jgi:hypothetical protein
MRRSWGYAFLGALLLLVNAAACAAEPRVIVATSDRRELVVPVEIADTPAKRELGLQYRPIEVTLTEHFQQLIDDGLLRAR